MTRFGRLLLLLSLAGLVAAIFVGIRSAHEPAYGGRTLAEWIQRYQTLDDAEFPAEARAAKAAILCIGTNELPRLARWIAYDPRAKRKRVVFLAGVLPRPVRHSRLLLPWMIDQEDLQASTATRTLRILGPAALELLPELTALANDTNRPIASQRALSVLPRLGSHALPALKALLEDRRNPNRLFVLHYLAELGTNASALSLEVANSLNDPNPAVRLTASNTLALIQPGSSNGPGHP